ncbi:MAG TPA: hypothetical protein VMU84_05605 [Thermoanaerobaculia bacterium]|nr:hypothetical protein [Thermoanaerobaculia bacterium]
MTGVLYAVGFIVTVGLVWYFLRLRQQDQLGEFMAKRRPVSKLVGRAEYVEGAERINVALALSEDTFYYENADLQASFELRHIDDIEYDDELATGKNIDPGYRALRLRSHGVTFEFILEPTEAPKWIAALPPSARESSKRAV